VDERARVRPVRVAIAGGGVGGMALIAVVEERAPDGFVDLDAVISREELEEIARSYKRTAGFDPEALNNRPSLAVRQHAAHAATSRP
jgi:hypothetical protein